MSKPIPANPMSTDSMTAQAAMEECLIEQELPGRVPEPLIAEPVAGAGDQATALTEGRMDNSADAAGSDHGDQAGTAGDTVTGTGLIAAIKRFKANHPTIYEFILFNILSNVATITNFVVLWFGTGLLFTGLSDRPFDWFIFHYPVKAGGLGGFISFLLAYVCAQVVNFIVQRKLVFSATVKIAKVLPWYILTVLVAGIVSIWLPPIVIDLLKPYVGGFAATLANVVNIFLQVVINWPMMKFVIMRKE